MQAIEFNSRFEHGQITVPKTLHLAEGQPVRVLLLLDETAAEKGAGQNDVKSVWERTAGAWQGNILVREQRREYEQRLDMKAPVSHSSDPDMQKVPQALMRAAEKARKLAEQTGTRLVVRKPSSEVPKKQE